MAKSKLLQMHNVGIVVESLDNAIAFFAEIGLKLEGRAMVEGEWAERVTGLGNQSVEIARWLLQMDTVASSFQDLSRLQPYLTIGRLR